MTDKQDVTWMQLAAEFAARGVGLVEPNPPVGCVIVRDDTLIASGYHQRFGGPHAEIVALQSTTENVAGTTVYVTLEPCSHFGKTPPCADELIRRQVGRVVVAIPDPHAMVNGQGLAKLREAGVKVDVGVGRESALITLRPYLKRIATGVPWVIAKWAMSLDGKIATPQGESRWLTSDAARQSVHELRGRMDAIMTGIGTVLADDPLLTARPAGPRRAVRVVVDSLARLPLNSQLVASARTEPVLVAVSQSAPVERITALREAGCEVWIGTPDDADQRILELLRLLADRQMTNVLVESGGTLLACFQRLGQIDEIRAHLAPRLLGGQQAPTPVEGEGIRRLADAGKYRIEAIRPLGNDVEITAVNTSLTFLQERD
ncbi:MAG TPA: bifunctional diaminohydroxyphosphoribosylaminopyrimidine deaminase/5-amino-6-(5-phosphoribosylamino)uracil reductase RibD [Pirellulaceae bacterium]|nr:bifunctional diaminohydroxyphosphoribosylaminopyrimidine deaminase/5-amino-6-(5-phosphoribosylamino)uracil reductase RibD [Pirellulaceae bacterium]